MPTGGCGRLGKRRGGLLAVLSWSHPLGLPPQPLCEPWGWPPAKLGLGSSGMGSQNPLLLVTDAESTLHLCFLSDTQRKPALKGLDGLV